MSSVEERTGARNRVRRVATALAGLETTVAGGESEIASPKHHTRTVNNQSTNATPARTYAVNKTARVRKSEPLTARR